MVIKIQSYEETESNSEIEIKKGRKSEKERQGKIEVTKVCRER